MDISLSIGQEAFQVKQNDKVLIVVDGEPYWVSVSLSKAAQGKPYRDREWLADAYHTKNMTLQEIADLCGVSAMAINQWLQKHGIPSRSRGRRTD